MKKLPFLLLPLLLCLFLPSCDPSPYRYDYDTLAESVESVSLVQYENPDQKKFVTWVFQQSSLLKAVDTEKITLLETMDGEKLPDFLQQLSGELILDTYYAYDSPRGICLRLNHKNGDFTLITCDSENKAFRGYIGRYTADGEVASFVGCFAGYTSFSDLVNGFFSTQVPTVDTLPLPTPDTTGA